MSILFNADEIFAIAVRIEQNGNRFYAKAAEMVALPSAKAVFNQLAQMEKDHEKTFSEMRENLSKDQRIPTTFDPEGETEAYLKALADERVFKVHQDPIKKLAALHDPYDIFAMAIDMEKDSIVFYYGMKQVVPEKLGQNRIEDIIQEEIKHISILYNEMAKI